MPIDYNHPNRRPRSAHGAEPATAEPVVSPPRPKIDYTHRGRRGRPATGAIQPSAVPSPPLRPEDEQSAHRRAAAPVRVDTAAAEPTFDLARAADIIDQLRPGWHRIGSMVEATTRTMLADVIAAHRDTRAEAARLEASYLLLGEAFQDRFGRTASGYGTAKAVTIAAWCEAADALTVRLRNDWVPITRSGREKSRSEFERTIGPLLSSYAQLRREFLTGEWSAMITAGTAAANRTAAAAAAAAPRLQLPPPPVGPLHDPADADRLEAGPGPVRIYLGTARAHDVVFESAGAEGCGSGTHTLPLPGAELPVVLDLDVVGGFAVSERSCLESPILNLLAALPANRLLVKIFDPERGGDSAKFLYNLGDAAERVIGERVRTTDRDLNDLLQETAEHITFVTQRYLQGEHTTLTSYNQAAGEVAEPYRLLVLYDFPSGFNRGGRPDTDLLDQVGKIVRNGPRTGVFTVFTAAADFLTTAGTSGAPQLSAEQQQLRRTVASLPRFAHELDRVTLDALAASPCTVPIASAMTAPMTHPAGAAIEPAIRMRWNFVPAPVPSAACAGKLIERIRRNQHTADDVRVTPERVAALLAEEQRNRAVALGSGDAVTAADPADDSTWWRASSIDGVSGAFGRVGARGVATLTLDSQVDSFSALIGGRPGSGKSVLLHAAIMGIALNYPPDEVDLFLIDFKEGVEFKRYADDGLPHARVVATEAERDFGLSVLRSARAEIGERGAAFKGPDGGAVNLAEYWRRSGERRSRWVLVIDEFQQLFYRDDAIAQEAAEIIEQIVRLGRSFGIHLVLASQTLAGMATLGKHVLGMIPQRIALQSGEADSRLILGEDNPDAQTLTRAGEGILNNRGGFRDANKRFQTAFWDPDARSSTLRLLTDRARRAGLAGKTRVFTGYAAADLAELRPEDLTAGAHEIVLPAGMSSELDARPVGIVLRRESGAHVLVVDEQGPGPLIAMADALAQRSVTVELVDFTSEIDAGHAQIAELDNAPTCTIHRRRALASVLERIARTVEERQVLNEFRASPVVLAFAAMGRARDFDTHSFDDSPMTSQLVAILRDGAEVGVHILAWFDRAAGVHRRLTTEARNEFAHRLVGRLSRDDSSSIISTETAADLKPGQAVLADLDRATEVRVRRFAASVPARAASNGSRW